MMERHSMSENVGIVILYQKYLSFSHSSMEYPGCTTILHNYIYQKCEDGWCVHSNTDPPMLMVNIFWIFLDELDHDFTWMMGIRFLESSPHGRIMATILSQCVIASQPGFNGNSGVYEVEHQDFGLENHF